MKLFAFVVLLVCIPASAFGIKCFVCFHAHPKYENVDEDLDCKTPHPKYLQECTDYTKLPGHDHPGEEFSEYGFQDEHNSNDNPESVNSDTKQFSCGSLVGYHANGTNVAVRYCQKKAADDYRRDELSGGKVGFSHVCNTKGCNDFTLRNAPVIDIAVISNDISSPSATNDKADISNDISSTSAAKATFSVLFVSILFCVNII